MLGSGTKSHEYQKVLKGRTGLSTVMLGQLSAHVFAKAQWPPPLLDCKILLPETIELYFSFWPLVNCDWATVVGREPWPPPMQHCSIWHSENFQMCFSLWQPVNRDLVTVHQKPPWPPPLQLEMQTAGVHFRPTHWPSFCCQTAMVHQATVYLQASMPLLTIDSVTVCMMRSLSCEFGNVVGIHMAKPMLLWSNSASAPMQWEIHWPLATMACWFGQGLLVTKNLQILLQCYTCASKLVIFSGELINAHTFLEFSNVWHQKFPSDTAQPCLGSWQSFLCGLANGQLRKPSSPPMQIEVMGDSVRLWPTLWPSCISLTTVLQVIGFIRREAIAWVQLTSGAIFFVYEACQWNCTWLMAVFLQCPFQNVHYASCQQHKKDGDFVLWIPWKLHRLFSVLVSWNSDALAKVVVITSAPMLFQFSSSRIEFVLQWPVIPPVACHISWVQASLSMVMAASVSKCMTTFLIAKFISKCSWQWLQFIEKELPAASDCIPSSKIQETQCWICQEDILPFPLIQCYEWDMKLHLYWQYLGLPEVCDPRAGSTTGQSHVVVTERFYPWLLAEVILRLNCLLLAASFVVIKMKIVTSTKYLEASWDPG